MANLPLLMFPRPTSADRARRYGSGGKIHCPSSEEQGQRLSPVLEALQINAEGSDPEQVLVLEIIESVDKFYKAVKRIDGFELLSELEIGDIEADENFYDEKKPDKPLRGQLYLIMYNQKALQRLLSMWKRYRSGQTKFDHGLAKFKDMFKYLKTIRRWDVEDRLEETGIKQAWQTDIEHGFGDDLRRCEIELWFRKNEQKQREAQEQVVRELDNLGGKVLTSCVIKEISYHAILVEMPAEKAQQLITNKNVGLVKCKQIMFFRPVGQIATEKWQKDDDISEGVAREEMMPSGDPTVAILDGMPMENHALLEERLIVDDPDNYAANYPINDRKHGTAMSSLVVHGDLGQEAPALSRPVYVRPVMKPHKENEHIPDNILIVDHIHRAVRRMFEGEGTTTATAPTIKIINFSIGDKYRPFIHMLSPLARLLDWLSVKHNVLFIISTGNYTDEICTGINRDTFSESPKNWQEAAVINTTYKNVRNRKILSPAECINGVTVGSLHRDYSSAVKLSSYVIDPIGKLSPSPFSAFGLGYRRSVKPDLIFDGGKATLVEDKKPATYKVSNFSSRPGTQTAAPSKSIGELDKTSFSCGTSNAAALVSRNAAICYDKLLEVMADIPKNEIECHITPLLKAMLIHGCAWGETGNKLKEIIKSGQGVAGQQVKNMVTQWIGYGVPDFERVLSCTERRATLIGYGTLKPEEAHEFKLPLPPSISGKRGYRKLTVTLAYLSSTIPSSQKYRATDIWFELRNRKLLLSQSSPEDADHRAAQRGTVQHQVFEDRGATSIGNEDAITIKVNCRNDASESSTSVSYGLMTTLEVAEKLDVAVYEEIRLRVEPIRV